MTSHDLSPEECRRILEADKREAALRAYYKPKPREFDAGHCFATTQQSLQVPNDAR